VHFIEQVYSQVWMRRNHISQDKMLLKACLEFAKKYHCWIVDDWSHMKFLDDSQINRFFSSGRILCWAHDPKELSKRMFILTVKYGSVLVMVRESIVCTLTLYDTQNY